MSLKDLLPWRKNEAMPVRAETRVTDLHREMNRLFEDFFGRFGFGRSFLPDWEGSGFAPKINVVEGDKEIRVTAELPGVNQDDVQLTLTENALTLKGEKRTENEEEGRNVYRSERSYGMFQRVVPLPMAIDPDRVEATFKNGVLTVSLPRPEQAEESRKHIHIETE